MSQAQAIQASLSNKKTFQSLAAAAKIKGTSLKLKPNPKAVDPDLAAAAKKFAELQDDLEMSEDTDEGLEVTHHIFNQRVCLDAHARRQAKPPGFRGTHAICCY
jgi:hypothetical protein